MVCPVVAWLSRVSLLCRQRGGLTVVQDPREAQAPTMPREAIRLCDAHLVLPLAAIRALLPLLETT